MSGEAQTIMKKAASAASGLKSFDKKKTIERVVKQHVGSSKYVGRGFFFSIPALIAGATALAKGAATGAATAVGSHVANKALKGRGLYTGREYRGRGMYTGREYRGRGLYTRESRRKAYKSVKAAGRSLGRFAYRGAKYVGRVSRDAAIEAAKQYVATNGPAAMMDTLGRAYEAYA